MVHYIDDDDDDNRLDCKCAYNLLYSSEWEEKPVANNKQHTPHSVTDIQFTKFLFHFLQQQSLCDKKNTEKFNWFLCQHVSVTHTHKQYRRQSYRLIYLSPGKKRALLCSWMDNRSIELKS